MADAVAPLADAAFLTGGEMGALMREHDWSDSPLGAPETWPQSLRSALSICLSSPGIRAIFWGPEFRLLYSSDFLQG